MKYSDEFLLGELLHVEAAASAFEAIFHRYYPMVLNFIRGMVKDGGLAEDIAQNIFMRLWLNRAVLDRTKSLKNWLCVLARNEAINVLRSKCSKVLAFQAEVPDTQLSDRTVEDWYNFVETNERLRSYIETMPLQRREIFKMSRYEHRSNMEIAVMLNISVRTVEKHIELALKGLRKYTN